MFRPAASQQAVQSLLSRATELPPKLHHHLSQNPSPKSYQDVVVRLSREITAFCVEIRELISWWKSDVPSQLAHADIDKLVGQCHVAFDKVARLVPLGHGQREYDSYREERYREDRYEQYALQDDDSQQNLEYVSAYINSVARTFHVMTEVFRIAETMSTNG
jgi:hypothetical protein